MRKPIEIAVAGVAAVVIATPAFAEEVKYNFTSEFSNQSVAGDARQGGQREGSVPGAADAGPKTAKFGYQPRPYRTHSYFRDQGKYRYTWSNGRPVRIRIK